MTREIKFNAIGLNEYIRFDDWVKGKPAESYPNELLAEFLKEHYAYELVQYTGIKDKYGREVYEGDIVRNGDKNHSKGCLGCNGNFKIDLTPKVVVKFESGMFKAGQMSLCSFRHLEIVGNVHEH